MKQNFETIFSARVHEGQIDPWAIIGTCVQAWQEDLGVKNRGRSTQLGRFGLGIPQVLIVFDASGVSRSVKCGDWS